MQLLLSLLLMAATAQAHYRFSKLVVNNETEAKEWVSVRMTKNYQDDHGVTDVNSADMRCFQMRAGTGTASVAAGDTVGFVADQGVTHPGPVQFYMARVPDGKDINSWEAAGNVWFKVASINGENPGAKTSGFTWPTYNKKSVSFVMPKSVPSGKYLLRIESIALHQAQSAGGAQFYLACAQIDVKGGNGGVAASPGPMVAFPGAYRPGGPGLIFSWQTTTYTPPGPAVWVG